MNETTNTPINSEELMATFDNDFELLAEIIELFLDDCPSLMHQIQTAIATDDASSLERAAHTLKGAVSNFVQGGAYDAATVLEQLGRVGDLSAAENAYTSLETEIHQLEPALTDMLESGND